MNEDSLFLKLLNNVGVGIFAIDLNRRITFFNSEAEKITGFKKEEAIGQKCFEIFRTELCFKNCHLKEAIKNKKTFTRIRNTILNKEQKEIPLEITASPLYDDKGRVIGGVESFIDDSSRVQVEKELYNKYSFNDIIGKDEKMLNIFRTLFYISPTTIPIIITGETGTGKDIFARAIHNASDRKDMPFVKVNCAALPSSLIESELFGYKKGAFTDAKTDKIGRFQEAHGGTLLLDEIGDLSVDLQAKLLQVLDENIFYPLGSKKSIKVDVRIIATTNKDIKKLIENKLFREDLYYRLNGVEIKLPPLRERKTDIPLLIDHFLNKKIRVTDTARLTINKNALKILLNYDYPGNVRELKHIIEFGLATLENNELTENNLPLYLKENTSNKKTKLKEQEKISGNFNDEKDIIIDTLKKYNWNRTITAKVLNINRSTLWRKIKKYGL